MVNFGRASRGCRSEGISSRKPSQHSKHLTPRFENQQVTINGLQKSIDVRQDKNTITLKQSNNFVGVRNSDMIHFDFKDPKKTTISKIDENGTTLKTIHCSPLEDDFSDGPPMGLAAALIATAATVAAAAALKMGSLPNQNECRILSVRDFFFTFAHATILGVIPFNS